MSKKKKDPWTDPDPQPGDFDEYLVELGPGDIQVVEAGSCGKVHVLDTDDVDGWLQRRRERQQDASAASRR